MFSIGDFARHGRVSVRMLRHYDAIGLLRPAHVDRVTGYRSYEARQLSRLNRIVALKDLGFTLQQTRANLDDNVQIKRIPGIRAAELTGTAASFEPESISPIIQPLYGELCARLDRAGLTPVGPAIAYYEDAPDSDGILVHATLPIDGDPGDDHDFSIVNLPEIEQAATILHRGSMDDVIPTIQTLARWIDANGYRSAGYNRELYIECGEDGEPSVTELQEPIATS